MSGLLTSGQSSYMVDRVEPKAAALPHEANFDNPTTFYPKPKLSGFPHAQNRKIGDMKSR